MISLAELINSTFSLRSTLFKMKYITLTWDRKQDTLFECLKDAFEYTEGVPKEIWFDNMRTVVDRPRTQYKKSSLIIYFINLVRMPTLNLLLVDPIVLKQKGLLNH